MTVCHAERAPDYAFWSSFRLAEEFTEYSDMDMMNQYCKEVANLQRRLTKLTEEIAVVNKVGVTENRLCSGVVVGVQSRSAIRQHMFDRVPLLIVLMHVIIMRVITWDEKVFSLINPQPTYCGKDLLSKLRGLAEFLTPHLHHVHLH